MDNRPVADADFVGDIQRRSVRCVHDRTILNIDPGPNANGRDIAADHDVVHDRGLVADDDVAPNV